MTGTFEIAGPGRSQHLSRPLPVILVPWPSFLRVSGSRSPSCPFSGPRILQGSPAPLPRFCPPVPRWPCRGLGAIFPGSVPPGWDYVWPVVGFGAPHHGGGQPHRPLSANVKRLLAYSSIAQMGYLLMTLLAVRMGEYRADVYLAVYAVMDLGLRIIGTFSGARRTEELWTTRAGL